MGRGFRLLISLPQLINTPLICTPFLNGASGVRLMRRWKNRRRLLSQSSCDVLLKGNYRIVPRASCLIRNLTACAGAAAAVSERLSRAGTEWHGTGMLIASTHKAPSLLSASPASASPLHLCAHVYL